MTEFTRALAGQIREESERTRDDPYPPGTRVTRPNAGRSRLFAIRLSEDEASALQEAADDAHLPVSTMARAWILDRLQQQQAS